MEWKYYSLSDVDAQSILSDPTNLPLHYTVSSKYGERREMLRHCATGS